MEDSYTVHRRRKAAARKREKTPDPSSRGATTRMDTTDDEDEERRARMERMADEAERVEQQDVPKDQPENKRENNKKKDQLEPQPAVRRKEKQDIAKHSANVDDMVAIRAEVAAKSAENSPTKTRETDAAAAATATGDDTRPVKQMMEAANKPEDATMKRETLKPEAIKIVKEQVLQDTPEISKETPKKTASPDETARSGEVRKVERRLKRKSKERAERYCRSTDSSDVDEKSESSRRRTKSPEAVARARLKKTSGKSRSGGSDPEASKRDAERLNHEKSSSSRQKTEEAEPRARNSSEKSHSRPYSQTEDTESEEPRVVKKSEEYIIKRRVRESSEKSRSGPYSQTEDTEPEEPRVMKKSESFPQKAVEEQVVKRSSSDLKKKQIIPLSNDSLIEDFARAQREYLLRERSILDPEPTDEFFQDAAEENLLRRRTFSLTHTESEHEKTVEEVAQPSEQKSSWFSWLTFWRRKKEVKEDKKDKKDEEVVEKKVEDEPKSAPKVEEAKEVAKQETLEKTTLLDFFKALRDVVSEFKAFVAQNPRETTIIRRMRNRCVAGLILVIIYCGLGAFVFRFIEGAFETFYKCGVKRVKRDFLDSLWNYSHNLREDDWKSMARKKLMEFEEQLHTAHEAGVHSYSGQKSWSFLNAVGYCLSVITTIGYGHISPSTNTGRAITIIYAIFGIPMFLIILADFGKLFTRGIKFLWAFVRRLYYTGSCRKVRRTVPVQEVMKGVQLVYDLAKFRRPSQMNSEEIQEMQKQQLEAQQQPQTVLNVDANAPDSPGTPALSAFAIDDEFNLPISVAIFILLGYIFVGAALYYIWEEWGFFESFYFVFISMSTIGFGDYVPKHPIYMMCSIVYLVFGLALTSMCINVVQVMLSDSFRQASQKIGATIGFEVAEDDNSVKPAAPPPVEIADVHMSMKESESGEKIAPKAKQEDVDL